VTKASMRPFGMAISAKRSFIVRSPDIGVGVAYPRTTQIEMQVCGCQPCFPAAGRQRCRGRRRRTGKAHGTALADTCRVRLRLGHRHHGSGGRARRLSVASGRARGAVCGGRWHRPAGAAVERRPDQAARAIFRGAQSARRQHERRHAIGGPGEAGRLHAGDVKHRPCGQSLTLQAAAVRSAQRPRADLADRKLADDPGGHAVAAAEVAPRPDRVHESAAGRAQLRLLRGGERTASCDRAVPVQDRRRHRARAVCGGAGRRPWAS